MIVKSPATIDDLIAMPEDGNKYELVDGTIIATSTPNSLDQLQELIRPPLEEGGEVALPQELNALRR